MVDAYLAAEVAKRYAVSSSGPLGPTVCLGTQGIIDFRQTLGKYGGQRKALGCDETCHNSQYEEQCAINLSILIQSR